MWELGVTAVSAPNNLRSWSQTPHFLWWMQFRILSLSYLTHWPLRDFERNFIEQIEADFLIDGWDISGEVGLRLTSLVHTYDTSTLVQVMGWCRQAPSHYLSQCWPRSVLAYGIIRLQWVNTLICEQNDQHFANDIFKYIFLNGDFYCISVEISLQLVSNGPMENKSPFPWVSARKM